MNSTYGAIVGFNKVAEDGITGWMAMFALTRALQSELDITTLSGSFGPTILAKLQARGGVPLGETNANIVQCACYCKGYDPLGITGTLGSGTQRAVSLLMVHAGVTDWLTGMGPIGEPTITCFPAKVVKALLAIDAYVVVAGGAWPFARSSSD